MQANEYTDPQAVALFSTPLPTHTGGAMEVADFDSAGMGHTRGAQCQTAPLAWGKAEEAPEGSAWVQATEIGDLTENGRAAYLWAAYEGGKLYLHMGADTPKNAGNGTDETNGTGEIGYFDETGMPHKTGRAVAPDLYLCDMESRDAYLKTPDGDWRAWLNWEILCTIHCRTAATPGQYGYPYEYITLWMIFTGNVLCFKSTSSTSVAGYNWASFGSVTRAYGYDPEDEDAGCTAGVQEVLGSVVPVVLGATAVLSPLYGIAPLPWQGDGGGNAVYDIGDDPDPDLGTLNIATEHDDTGYPKGTSMTACNGYHVCPRLHVMAAMAPSVVPHAGINVEQVQAILYGNESYFPTYGGIYYLPAGGHISSGVPVVPAFNMLFDPFSVEGLGLHKRDTSDFARVDAPTYLPPIASEWKRVAATTLRGPAGDVYIDIAGAETADCLLTASGSTENLT